MSEPVCGRASVVTTAPAVPTVSNPVTIAASGSGVTAVSGPVMVGVTPVMVGVTVVQIARFPRDRTSPRTLLFRPGKFPFSE
jgi:hypothetical protein